MNLFGVEFRFYEPELVRGPKIVYENFFGTGINVSETVVTTWFIMFFFFVVFKVFVRKLEVVPTTKKQILFESLYNFYDWLTESVLKKWKSKFMAYVGTLITFVFFANTIVLFPIPVLNSVHGKLYIDPAFRTPTSDLNTTLGLGLMTAILFVAYGIRAHGFGYFKEFMEPHPVMLPLHLVSELAKPFSIAMRLFGNMFGGAVIMALFYMFAMKAGPAPLIMAPLHLYFDLFIGLVQSFIFTMLTMVFIATAIGDAEPDSKHHH